MNSKNFFQNKIEWHNEKIKVLSNRQYLFEKAKEKYPDAYWASVHNCFWIKSESILNNETYKVKKVNSHNYNYIEKLSPYIFDKDLETNIYGYFPSRFFDDGRFIKKSFLDKEIRYLIYDSKLNKKILSKNKINLDNIILNNLIQLNKENVYYGSKFVILLDEASYNYEYFNEKLKIISIFE